jgi:hypothetical protein
MSNIWDTLFGSAWSANTVLASPNGSAGALSPRALVAADIPNSSVTPVWNNLQNATGSLTLANAGNATTFNQTSAVNWAWANTTAATSGSSSSSPLINLNGTYWTGAASATDTWTIQNVPTAGTNGPSQLQFAHSGTSGSAYLLIPTGTPGTNGAFGLGFAGTATVGLGVSTNTLAIMPSGANSTILTGYSSTTQSWTLTAAGSSYTMASIPTNSIGIFSGKVSTSVAVVASVILGNNAGFTGTAAGTQVGVSAGNGGTGSTSSLNWAPTSGTTNFVALQVNPVLNQTGSASGSYTGILLSAVETALLGGSNKFLDLQGGTGGTTSRFTINNSGIVSNYNTIATVRNGVPASYAKSDLTAQSAAITATTLYAAASTGAYRISWSAAITTASDGSSVLGGTNGFQVLYTSPTDSVVKTTVAGNSVTSSANTTGTAVGGSIVVYAKTGTNIQYTYGYTSVQTTTAMAYELHLTCEEL